MAVVSGVVKSGSDFTKIALEQLGSSLGTATEGVISGANRTSTAKPRAGLNHGHSTDSSKPHASSATKSNAAKTLWDDCKLTEAASAQVDS